MSRLQALKGTRDFYPDRMRVRQWIEATWRETSERFGFQAYDAPVIEPLELYTRKSGEEIVEQLYAFEDKGGRGVALRPEMTPSLARMVAAKSQGIPKPIKWYSIPRLFRYEQPQRGRLREFFQLNLDIVGVEGVEADAEIIAAGVEVLRAFGLTADDFVVRYSDRRLLDAVLTGLSIPAGNREAIYAALDRLAKSEPDAVVEKLGEAGVPEATARRLVEAIGRRDLAGLQEALVPAGVHLAPEVAPLMRLERLLDAYGVADFAEFDSTVVRGLAYYTGVVFEFYDRAGELRAICGGGRFDDLVASAGGEDLPAVGFGLGDAVLLELLEERGLAPDLPPRCDVYVIPVSEADRETATRAATRLRSAGISTDLMLVDRSVGKGFKGADQAGARVAIVIGEREREQDVWTVKDLKSGAEETLAPDAAIERLSETLDGRAR